MTTPLIKTITWQQVAKKHASNWWDKLWTSGTPDWACPPPDRPPIIRDTTPAGTVVEEVVWGKYDLPVKIETSTLTEPAYGSFVQTGMPMEKVPVSPAHMPVWIDSPWHGNQRMELIPIPAGEDQLQVTFQGSKGTAWLEGMPQQGGAYDHHWIGFQADGSSWELIGARWVLDPRVGQFAWWATECALWDKDGKLMSGNPATAAGVQLSSMIVTPAVLASPARVGVVFPNYADRDGTDKTAPIKCGDVLRLRKPPDPAKVTGDQYLLQTVLYTHGMKIFDRMGENVKNVSLVTQAGEPWKGSNLAGLNLKTSDFVRVRR